MDRKSNEKKLLCKSGVFLIWAALCSLFFSGCGKAGNMDADSGSMHGGMWEESEYYDIQAKEERIFAGEDTGLVLGMQYYRGEPVRLWTENGEDVYLQHEDGTKELVLEGMQDAGLMSWYACESGDLCCWKQEFLLEPGEASVVIVTDSTGKESCRLKLDEDAVPEDVCQLEDGRILVLARNRTSGVRTLEAIDPATGKASKMDGIWLRQNTASNISVGAEGLMVLEKGISAGLREVGTEDGSQILAVSFSGSSGRLGKETPSTRLDDFRMLEDGSIELLWYEMESMEGIRETLRLTRIEKEVIVMRTYLADSWMKERVVEFNQSNGTCYLMLEECPEGTSRRDFAAQTSLEIGAGKGPDILYGQILESSTYAAMAVKGVFEDFTPYLKESGIREEDYYPFAFDCWREGDKIYALCLAAFPYYYYVDRSILDVDGEPDIEEMLEGMLDYDGKAYYGLMTSEGLLSFFLGGSEDFWGMLDWEMGVCDFSGELFAQILEVSRRYGCEKLTDGPDRPILGDIVNCKDLYYFDTAEELREQERVMAGPQFDDGAHARTMLTHIVAVNSGSKQKEGAWSFLCSLLGKEAQMKTALGEAASAGNWSGVPANRAALDAVIEKEFAFMEEGKRGGAVTQIRYPNGEVVTLKNKSYEPEEITQERIAEYKELLEGVRYNPFHTIPLMDIICEEAGYYFHGDKGIEETVAVIENRVQLYMDENR